MLNALNIEVLSNVIKMPTDADILLLRRETAEWTDEQLILLPDGIRDSKARHILIDFKSTPFNKNVFKVALSYDYLYKQAKRLADQEVQTILFSAKKPQTKTLKRFDYSKTQDTGVYRSTMPILDHILLLSLNELSDEPYNAWVKCFASRKKIRKQALKRLKALASNVNRDLEYFMLGLSAVLCLNAPEEGEDMIEPPTPEEVTEMGKMWRDVILDNLTIEDMLARFEAKEVLSHLKPAEIEDYLKQLKKSENS
jgi:hypothetical protein